jgi:hypothetical protein
MRSILAATATILALGGCASVNGYPDDPVDTASDAAALKNTYDAAALTAYASAPSKGQRNAIVYGRMLAYDAAFYQFERDLTGQSNLLNVGGSATNTVITTSAALAKSARTKTRLSAWALALTGIRADTSKQLFYDKTLPSVLSQMEANRLKLRVAIEEGLTKSIDEYPLAVALVDLQAYKNAGSIATAVSAIARTAENEKTEATKDIAVIRRASYACDENCERIKAWAYDSNTKAWDDNKFKAMEQELAKLRVRAPLASVINTNREPTFAGARALIVANLNIPPAPAAQAPAAASDPVSEPADASQPPESVTPTAPTPPAPGN